MFSRFIHPLLWLVLCLTVVAWLPATGALAAEPAAAGGRHELTLRLRYPDGRAASGAVVNLRRLPDREIVGWRFADNACRSDERGECRWSVWTGLYEFEFEGNLQPDSLTLAAAGGHGLYGLGVYLDQDFTVGLALADPLTGGAGETLFFDLSPEAAQPTYRSPSLEDLYRDEAEDAGSLLAAAETTVAAAVEPAAESGAEGRGAEGRGAEGGALSWPLLLAAVGLAVGGLFFYRRSLTPPETAAAVVPGETEPSQREA
jgi:hypothetical protein